MTYKTACRILRNLCLKYPNEIHTVKEIFPHLTKEAILKEFCVSNKSVHNFNWMLRYIKRYGSTDVWWRRREGLNDDRVKAIIRVFGGRLLPPDYERWYHEEALAEAEGRRHGRDFGRST